ncbi:hypothetical protein G9G54_13530 [Paenibacillus sp. EKM212P]|uniref:hypothetical protein n=1 Tax=Paenibacillus sp. EKM212P TaxID=1683680 RepID=UPI0013ECBEEC|nr:hypothetical protein [Paenibacillus sp. EKM212P]KAF6578293.1 hypothetical protein G9G54_13530 [Paenibacillus sp. EKM212P]
MEYWTSSPTKTKQAIVTLADGLNQFTEPIEIKDSQSVAAINLDSALYPTLQVVDGHTLHSQHTGFISRLFKFDNRLYCTNGKGLYRYSGGSWAVVFEPGGEDNSRPWPYSMFFDGSKLFFSDGDIRLRQWDGVAITTIDNAPIGESFITSYSNRFFLAGKGDNLLSFSGLRDATDWTSTDKYVGTGKITVETSDGEKPSGLAAFSNHVILFKKNTMHKLFGEDSTNFNMTQPYGVGCVSDRSIVPTRDSLFWLGPDGFYDYMGGAAPTKISDPIKNYIAQINPLYAHNCCAGTDGRFIYLSLVMGTATLPNVTLKYDMQGGRWWPVSFVATSYYLDGQTLYFGTADGKIMKVGGNDFAGTAINWSIETKPFSEDDETVRKTINRLFVVADIEPGSTLNVAYAGGTEGVAWNQVYTTSNGTGAIQSIRIPVIVRTPETWYRLKLSGTGKAKIHRIIREVSKRNG